MPSWITRDRLAVAAAVLAPLLVCFAMSLVRTHIANTDAALVLVLVVVTVAANGYRIAGVLAAVSGALWFDFFLTQPYGRLAIDRRFDVETTVLLLAVGVAVSELSVWGRRQAALASDRASYLAGIRAATETVSLGGSANTLIQDVARELVHVLGLSACRFEYGTAGLGKPPRLRSDGELEWLPGGWDVERQGLPPDVEVELLVETAGRLKGRYLMKATPGSHPSRTQRLVAVTLAHQVGSAIG